MPNIDVKVLPVNNYSSTIDVFPSDDGETSTVEWHRAFYRGYPNNDPPPELYDEAAIKAVTAVYQAGLAALKKTWRSWAPLVVRNKLREQHEVAERLFAWRPFSRAWQVAPSMFSWSSKWCDAILS